MLIVVLSPKSSAYILGRLDPLRYSEHVYGPISHGFGKDEISHFKESMSIWGLDVASLLQPVY
jgi:hypothetical protein